MTTWVEFRGGPLDGLMMEQEGEIRPGASDGLVVHGKPEMRYGDLRPGPRQGVYRFVGWADQDLGIVLAEWGALRETPSDSSRGDLS